MTNLGLLIRSCRRFSRDSNLKGMADYIGIGVAHLSSIEHGKVEPTPEELKLIAAYITGLPRHDANTLIGRDHEFADNFTKLIRTTPTGREPTSSNR